MTGQDSRSGGDSRSTPGTPAGTEGSRERVGQKPGTGLTHPAWSGPRPGGRTPPTAGSQPPSGAAGTGTGSRPAATNVDIVDNLAARRTERLPQPGADRQRGGWPDAARVDIVDMDGFRTGGAPPRTGAPGDGGGRDAARVDIVDTAAARGRGYQPGVVPVPPRPFASPDGTRPDGGGLPGTAAGMRGADGLDMGDTLAELDRLREMGGPITSQPLPPRPPPDPTEPMVLIDPVMRPRQPSRGDGPMGPSRQALDAVSRAADARLTVKERLAARAAAKGVDPGAGAQPSRQSASGQARHGTTVSQATLSHYLHRGHLLLERYRRELGMEASAETDPIAFVNWMLSLKPTVKSSTWRMYRACLYHFLEGFPSYDVPMALSLLDADVVDYSRPAAKPAAEKPGRRTSALKEKRLPPDDYDRLMAYLQTFSRSRLAQVLADWLQAGVATGLRPSEWRATDLEERGDPKAVHGRRVYLYVLNAKATNGRGTGVVRTLDISAFADPDVDAVRRMVDRSRGWLETGRFGDVQGLCATLLYTAEDRIWPGRRQHYSLYSCRHQAIANWKTVLQPAEIAAIVGHGVTATAGEHYGKRRSSWPPERIPAPPRPVAEELAVVRDRIRLFQRRLEMEVRAGLRKPGDLPEFPVG